MSSLGERMEAALKSRKERAGGERVNKAGLARACKIAASSVNDWFTGKTKSLEGENLIHASAYLQVSANWLATGAGVMAPYTTGSSTSEPSTALGNFAHDSEAMEYAGTPQYKGKTPVIANIRVGADGYYEEELIAKDAQGWVESASGAAAYGVRIKGDGLYPAYEADMLLLVRPDAELESGKRILLGLKDGRKAVRKFLFRGIDSLSVMPIQGGPPQTIDIDVISFAHRIFGSVDATEWRAGTAADPGLVMTPPAYGDLIDELDPAKKQGAK